MAHQTVPETALRRALNSLGQYVVLGSQNVLANIAERASIDLLVEDAQFAERQLIAKLGTPLLVTRRSSVTSFLYDWGAVNLLSNLEWRGARYLDAPAMLQDRLLSPSGLPQPRPAHNALISWFSSLQWGKPIKPRHRNVIIEAVRDDGDELAQVLRIALGRRWGRRLWRIAAQGRPEESEVWAGEIRRAVLRRSLVRAPLHTMVARISFCFAETRRFLNPPVPWMTVLGPDGSGKSTLLAGLRSAWPQSLGAVHLHHLRPGRLTRLREATGPVIDPHARPPRGPVMSVAALTFVILDWWIGYWTWIIRQRTNHGFVVFDRHLLDILVDPVRYRYGGPSWVARAACHIVPRPDVIVVLDAPAVVVRSRKQEVTPAESERQSLAYRRLATEIAGAYLVDASVPSEQVLDIVMTILRRVMRQSTSADDHAAVGRRPHGN
jgi:thymidylate kinase